MGNHPGWHPVTTAANFMDKLIDLRLEVIDAQLNSLNNKFDRMHHKIYMDLCLPGNHFFISHNAGPLLEGQLCLCGKIKLIEGKMENNG